MAGEIKTYPLIIGGEMFYTKETGSIYCKYDGSEYARISIAGEAEVNAAVNKAKAAFEETYFDVQTRYNVLMKAAELMRERLDDLAETLTNEAGKIIQDAKNEVLWTIDLLVESAEEAKRITGETVCFPVPWLDTRTCYTRHEPIGIVAAITPFNFPLNLVAHKVAPALAAGNPVVLKPAMATSIIAYKFCQLFLDAGLPKGFLSYLSGPGKEVGDLLVKNQDISFYSFTGSVAVGKEIKEKTGLRKCAMELGSNSATIVCDDYDIDAAARSCAEAAFTNAGQVCISLQRIYVQRKVFDSFVKRITDIAANMAVGNPADAETFVGPLISSKEAERVMEWMDEATAQGALAHCGHKREGSLVWPTVLTNVTRDMRVMKEEVFGPVVSVVPFDSAEEAFAMVNDSSYGLNSGILTNDMSLGMKAAAALKTGGVIIGGTCGFRFGNMPYGGVKDSGIGREGPRYAIMEMTELKTVVILS